MRIGTTDANGNTTRQVLDAEGWVALSIDGKFNITTYRYDTEGRLEFTDALDGGRTRREYDASDNLVAITDPSGNRTTYTYRFDGRVETATKGGAGYAFTYDSVGRLATQADNFHGITLTSVYSTAGDRTTRTDSKGGTVTSGYDADHRLTSRSQSETGVMGLRDRDHAVYDGRRCDGGAVGRDERLLAAIGSAGERAGYHERFGDIRGPGGVHGLRGSALREQLGCVGERAVHGGYFDRLLGLYGMHWRSYDPQSGQWTSEDPIGFSAGDMNQRRYVGNGATNGVDRNGLEDPTPGPTGYGLDRQNWRARAAGAIGLLD